MIKTLELYNFQGHKFSSLNLHPGVNIIKGRSHSGKTSIIRALRWALQNKPDGEGFRNWYVDDKAEIKVAIEFDDTFIVRTRSKKNNGYKLPNTELNAIGRELPAEVAELTRMNDLNLQSQHDTYFMLQDSSSSALQRLNEVVGLEIIGDTLKEASKRNTRLLNEARATESRIQELDEEISSLEYLDFAGKVIEKINSNLKMLEEYTKERHILNSLVSVIKEKSENIADYDAFLESEKLHEQATEIVRHIYNVRRQLNELLSVYRVIAHSSQLIQEYEERLKQEILVDRLLLDCDKIKTLRSERVSLESLCQSIRKSSELQGFHAEKLVKLQEEYNRIQESAEICPMCGQKLPKGRGHLHEDKDDPRSLKAEA